MVGFGDRKFLYQQIKRRISSRSNIKIREK